jgi:hypothetical protein
MLNTNQISLFDLAPISQIKPVPPRLTDELKADFVTSGKTSIFRSGLSAPVKVLIEKSLFQKGSSLNYGKGRHNFDSDGIEAVTDSCQNYDYVFQPDIDVLGTNYINVYAGYVVNTLPVLARAFVWCQMAKCTNTDIGVCFVAARTDKILGIKSGDGVITSKKTFQKSYKLNELVLEAKQHFDFVVEIKGKSGFSIVACSHSPLPDYIIQHAK